MHNQCYVYKKERMSGKLNQCYVYKKERMSGKLNQCYVYKKERMSGKLNQCYVYKKERMSGKLKRKDVRKTKSFDIGFDLAMSLVVPEIRRRPKVESRKMAAILNDDEE